MATPELVNPIPVDEARGWLTTLARTFLGDPYGDDFRARVEWRTRQWRPDRVWGYRDAGTWVATLATEPRSLTVPGPGGDTGDLAVDALTAATVAATHRRRGMLTSMITQALQAAKDRGDPLSMLVAVEWPIYGRFGYAPAAHSAEYTYWPRRPFATLPPAPAGMLRHVEAAEIADTAFAVFDAARRRRAGDVNRDRMWWSRELGLDGIDAPGTQPNWVLHEGADGPDGLLAWRPTRHFELDGRLGAVEVVHFAAATDAAYRNLWAYLGGIDAVSEIRLSWRPVDEPVRWLLADGRALEPTGIRDTLWVRLLDVPAALSARTYAVPGRIVLEVVDEAPGGYGAGRFVLEADKTTAQCTPTDAAAELLVTQQALAACYLGGSRLRALPSGVEEVAPGALARADLMFSTPLAPVNQTIF